MATELELPKELTGDLLYARIGAERDGYTLIENNITEINRWSYTHQLIISDDDANFWRAYVEEAATEMQDDSDFDDGEEFTIWTKVRRTTPATWNWETAR